MKNQTNKQSIRILKDFLNEIEKVEKSKLLKGMTDSNTIVSIGLFRISKKVNNSKILKSLNRTFNTHSGVLGFYLENFYTYDSYIKFSDKYSWVKNTNKIKDTKKEIKKALKFIEKNENKFIKEVR